MPIIIYDWYSILALLIAMKAGNIEFARRPLAKPHGAARRVSGDLNLNKQCILYRGSRKYGKECATKLAHTNASTSRRDNALLLTFV